MDIFNLLTFIGGLALFLFGMNVMGKFLEKRAGDKLKDIIGKLTSNKFIGLLTGLGVTAIIQSSSATTVMVVGFVNSGIMNLAQAINVIMGANIGTTVTSWLLSLTGISGSNVFVKLLKPSSFSPILALVGIVLVMFSKKDKKKDTGMILLGFATLMFGMETMSGAVSGLKNNETFKNLFIAFENPILGVLVGALVTAVIQSSSASIGILQAFAITGQISYSAAIPIILGQNIGTCITALLSAIGANKNAKRASLVHLFFNIFGTIIFMVIFIIIKYAVKLPLLDESASLVGIAIVHTAFNIFSTIIIFPMGKLLEKLVYILIPEGKGKEKVQTLDDRLLITPAIALEQTKLKIVEMAKKAGDSLCESLDGLISRTSCVEKTKQHEDETDKLEDVIGTYLVKLSSKELEEYESMMAGEYMKIIGDLERIADHGLNLAESNEELISKSMAFSPKAIEELTVLAKAVRNVWNITFDALVKNDDSVAMEVEPLEQVVDELKLALRDRHIIRLQKEECSIDLGFVWSDILTNLERISDHCANIAGCIIDGKKSNMNTHKNINKYKYQSEQFKEKYNEYKGMYTI